MIYNSLASIRRAQSVAASAHRERKDLAAPPSPASICIAATVTQMAKKAFAGVYSEDVILKWLKTFYRRFFAQQFKRSCLPDGPKVGSVSLSPRGDWRMPSDLESWWQLID